MGEKQKTRTLNPGLTSFAMFYTSSPFSESVRLIIADS